MLAAVAAAAAFVAGTGPFLSGFPPVEDLAVTGTFLEPDRIVLRVVNGGRDPVSISQVQVDDAYWAFSADPPGPLPRLGRVEVTIPYPWVRGEAHEVTLVSSTGLTFPHRIEVAVASPRTDLPSVGFFALIGVLVGVLPVGVGLVWYPAVRRTGTEWMGFLLAFTAGLLVLLAVEALGEGMEQGSAVPAPFHPAAVLWGGAILAFLLVEAASRRLRDLAGPGSRGLVLAWSVALGIGLHNLGEGLAIGSAYRLGESALGTALVVGFALHNATEGFAIVAPLGTEGRPARDLLGPLALMGTLAGAPTIAGAWIGAFTSSPVLAVLYLGVGAGAVLQVVHQIVRLLGERVQILSPRSAAGFSLGLAVMYATSLYAG